MKRFWAIVAICLFLLKPASLRAEESASCEDWNALLESGADPNARAGTGVAGLSGSTSCFGQNGNRYLDTLQQKFGRSVNRDLFSVLERWDIVPSWINKQPNKAKDWLTEFHSRVLAQDWPTEIKDATVAIIEGRRETLALSIEHNHVITMFDSTPAYLAQLLEIVYHPFVPPASDDPDALMVIDPDRIIEALDRLAEMLSMLKETSYLEGPDVIWQPAVIFATRFIYYHELGHLVIPMNRDFYCVDLYPMEQYLDEEICADLYALSLLALETRSSSDFQVAAMSGIALAMSLIAAQEFVNEEELVNGTIHRSIKGTVLRMERILHEARIAVREGYLSYGALRVAEEQWQRFKEMLRYVVRLRSPVFRLLRETAAGPKDDWSVARNEIVKWCVFGECTRLAATLNMICESVKDQMDVATAPIILKIVEYIVGETRGIEQWLGLQRELQQRNDGCSALATK